MTTRSDKYWQRRFEEVEKIALKNADDYIRVLEQEYAMSQARISKEITYWYTRFAKNEGLTLSEARQKLTQRELQEFRWTLEDYIAYGRENAINQEWVKQLENASAKYHIERLEALRIQLHQEVMRVYQERQVGMEEVVKKSYKDAYYHSAFEIQKGIGVGTTFHAIDERKRDKIIRKPWTTDGKTFSQRIWRDQQALANRLQSELTQALSHGEPAYVMVDRLADAFGVSKYEANRLAMTEAAAFASQGQEACFKELGVKRYIYIATLDMKTSEICQDMDGEIYRSDEREIGITAPPMHPHCRSTTAPYFEGLKGVGTRSARDPVTGKTVPVPREITYREWYETYVNGGEQERSKSTI